MPKVRRIDLVHVLWEQVHRSLRRLMTINSIRRMIVRQAGGANKLGWFSWAAAIFGAVALLVMGVAVAYQLMPDW